MTRTVTKLLIGTTALLLAGCATNSAPMSAEAPAARADMVAPAPRFVNLQALADRYVAEGKVANMVIGVGIGDRPALWTTAGTLALGGGRAADEQSIYRIYSMTKPVMGVLAALMIEDGTLSLDQPIADILPEFTEMQVVVDRDGDIADVRPAETPITIRHLLTHTAGFTYGFNDNAVARAYRPAGIIPGQRRMGAQPGDGPQPEKLREFAGRIAELPLVAEPGTEWHYSVSLDVLGAVVEEVTGQPLGEVLQARVFAPLGMDDTGFVIPRGDNDRLATNYIVAGAMPLPVQVPPGTLVPIDAPPASEYNEPGPFASGGGGLASTGEDYMIFMRAIADRGMVNGRRIFPARAMELVTTNLLPDGVVFGTTPGLTSDGPQGYGAGGRLIVNAGGSQPLGSYGWGGAAGTLASTVPSSRASVVLMTQYMPQQAYPLPQDLAAALAADMAAMSMAR